VVDLGVLQSTLLLLALVARNLVHHCRVATWSASGGAVAEEQVGGLLTLLSCVCGSEGGSGAYGVEEMIQVDTESLEIEAKASLNNICGQIIRGEEKDGRDI
jgi:hypothetical protein